MLKINNLSVSVDDKTILNNFDLQLNDGEIHVLMGKNGTGKSTISKVIMGDESYKVNSGDIYFNDTKLNDLSVSDRALLKIFLLGQNPIAVEGITTAGLLRTVLGKDGHVDIFKFNKELEEICEKLDLPKNFIHREINVGASGGERKKSELIQLWMLKPNLIILDELDSGLDVDALKICANSINDYYKEYKPTILIITHHTQIFDYIKPSKVHILANGKIIKTGNLDMAYEIEKNGFSITNELDGIDNYE